jgi:riboflavin biosynthesis pyrimidine reductase
LKAADFQTAIITGGSMLNSEFGKRGLIDEVILDVNPSIVGDGLPIFQPADFALSLELVAVEKIEDDIVELRYRVKK